MRSFRRWSRPSRTGTSLHAAPEDSATGSHRSIKASIRLKIAVLAPMPSASVTMAVAVKDLFLAKVRSA